MNPTTQTLSSLFSSPGFQSVRAETMGEAAQLFALRVARKEFGRRGDCRTCTLQSYAQDGSLGEYSAFIGRTHGNETTGRNIHLTVRRTP